MEPKLAYKELRAFRSMVNEASAGEAARAPNSSPET